MLFGAGGECSTFRIKPMKCTVKRRFYMSGEFYEEGQVVNIPKARAKQISTNLIKMHKGFDKRQTKVKPTYTYEQSGSWYTIFKGGDQIDKFQGKDKLANYGLSNDK